MELSILLLYVRLTKLSLKMVSVVLLLDHILVQRRHLDLLFAQLARQLLRFLVFLQQDLLPHERVEALMDEILAHHVLLFVPLLHDEQQIVRLQME